MQNIDRPGTTGTVGPSAVTSTAVWTSNYMRRLRVERRVVMQDDDRIVPSAFLRLIFVEPVDRDDAIVTERVNRDPRIVDSLETRGTITLQ